MPLTVVSFSRFGIIFDMHWLNLILIADQDDGEDCFIVSGVITDLGFNLDKDDTCGFTTTVTAFTLPDLGDNGGPTQTHKLDPAVMGMGGREAIDRGALGCGPTDQRGEFRPVNYPGIDPIDTQTRCDIGAFEVQLPLP